MKILTSDFFLASVGLKRAIIYSLGNVLADALRLAYGD
jgi:hypothetical protein